MKSRLVPKTRLSRGISRDERNRRLRGLGFEKYGDEEDEAAALAIIERFRVWTDHEPCVITGWRSGEYREFEGRWYIVGIEWAHVTGKRGSWCADFGVTVPLFSELHHRQEDDPEFFRRRGMDEAELARLHAVRFFREHPEDAAWILEHANDGDAVALARQGLEER